MSARIAPFPHPHSITDAFGSTIEVSHYQIAGSPRVVVEITEGEIGNVHLTISQAEALRDMLTAQTAAAKRGVSVAMSDNLPGDAA